MIKNQFIAPFLYLSERFQGPRPHHQSQWDLALGSCAAQLRSRTDVRQRNSPELGPPDSDDEVLGLESAKVNKENSAKNWF